MVNPLKELFAPRVVVGLEVAPQWIGAIKVINTLKGPELNHAAYKPVKDADRIDEDLKELFADGNLEHEMLVTCLPSSLAVVRQISLPFQKARKLERVIKYQMEPYLPYPVEEMLIDYLQPDSNASVTTIGVQKKVLSDHLARMALADLKPNVVTLDDLGLVSLYLYASKGNGDSAVALIHVEVNRVSVQVVRNRMLDFIRILPGEKDRHEQILRTLNLYQLKEPDVVLEEILLVGDSKDGGALANQIGSSLGIRASLWRPFDLIDHRLGEMETEMQSRLSVPLGLALSACGVMSKTVNLRKEEYRIASALDVKRMLTILLSGLLLFACLLTFNLFQKVHIQESRQEALKGEIRKVFSETFPNTNVIIKGRELDQMKQKIQEESAKLQWLDDIAGSSTVLEILNVLTATVSGFPDVTVENVSTEEGEVRVDGTASSFETVDRLKEKLSGTGSFESVKLAGAKMDKAANLVRFNFGLEKKK